MNTEIILGLLEEENCESEESEEEDVIKSKEKVNEKEEGDTEETKKKRVNKTPESSKDELQEEEVQVEAKVLKEAGVQEGSDMDEDESELEDGEVPCEIQDMNNSTNDEGSDEEAPAKKKQNIGNKAQHDFEDETVPALIKRNKNIEELKQKLKKHNETTSSKHSTRKVFKCTNGCPRTFSTAAKRTEHFETSNCSDFLY